MGGSLSNKSTEERRDAEGDDILVEFAKVAAKSASAVLCDWQRAGVGMMVIAARNET